MCREGGYCVETISGSTHCCSTPWHQKGAWQVSTSLVPHVDLFLGPMVACCLLLPWLSPLVRALLSSSVSFQGNKKNPHQPPNRKSFFPSWSLLKVSAPHPYFWGLQTSSLLLWLSATSHGHFPEDSSPSRILHCLPSSRTLATSLRVSL